MRYAFFIALLFLAGCGTAPSRIDNACAIFAQRDGLFNNWAREAKRASREYGVPVPVLMATIYTESGFRAYARPKRIYLLGFIPWKRPSSAYGYAQALDGTWSAYQRETGRWAASRTDFGDAIKFVGWYHNKSHRRNGIALTDTYRLYLAYYAGHGGYERGSFTSAIRAAAQRSAGIAERYERQLHTCGY
jgi:hypothetical protein